MPTIEQFSPIVNGHALFPGITVDLVPGEILPIVGRSGCGKTSLFNAIRQQIPHTGITELTPDCVFSVFQENSQLFPWFTVSKNLQLVCDDQWQELVKKWALTDLLSKYPNQLSVGQRQRFTLIRAICSAQNILLCDEPLSGVDSITKQYILKDFRIILKETKKYCLWITHDLSEAKTLSDHILIISTQQTTVVSATVPNDEIFSIV